MIVTRSYENIPNIPGCSHMICTAKGADHIRKRLCLVIICQIKSLSVECCESSFPSIEAVSLNGLSNDLNLIERSCAGIVEASGDGNGLEHSGGISTSGQSAVVLQDELRIKLTNGENIASFNADNAPAFAQLADQQVQSCLVAIIGESLFEVGITGGNQIHPVADIDSSADVSSVFANIVDYRVLGDNCP